MVFAASNASAPSASEPCRTPPLNGRGAGDDERGAPKLSAGPDGSLSAHTAAVLPLHRDSLERRSMERKQAGSGSQLSCVEEDSPLEAVLDPKVSMRSQLSSARSSGSGKKRTRRSRRAGSAAYERKILQMFSERFDEFVSSAVPAGKDGCSMVSLGGSTKLCL
eukprot:TRINITY_DN38664_c0_g1_i1.p1 TRINITY_DN38664_c0_g1~~TRINITY_DN38664_c0_g1_i1.p1  ORF type:complete len:185 (-),score=24.61 TRINITY_DN38664_c0_g1_i1:55-546(-)